MKLVARPLLSIVLTTTLLCQLNTATTTLTISHVRSDSVVDCLTQGCSGSREYCDSTSDACRAAATTTECYNATATKFQEGCDDGYKCVDDLCRVSTKPIDARNCRIICTAGKFCENDTTKCRGPRYHGECFNLETGSFQDGCDDGYFCSFNKCVDVSLDD